MAPFVFVALAFACAASRLGYVTPWAVSALVLVAAGVTKPAGSYASSSLALAVLSYALLVVANALFISAAYTPAGLYLPLLLALGFIVARRFDDRDLGSAAIAALGLGTLLGAWGLVQIGPLGMARAQALFETPATYAAVLNLLLVPVLALCIAGRRRAAMLAVGGLLAAGMFAADSRGGLIALVAGVGAATIFSIRAKRFRWRDLGLALAMLAAGWIVAAALRAWPAPERPVPNVQARAESSMSRLELYALSWNAWRERPLAGTGYLTFRYTLEQGRAQVPSYDEANETWFVHNDYLQTLQELGPLGLAALLALAWLPALTAYRKVRDLRADQQPAAIAAASALTAMAAHALVDFPFYIPVCLLLYGALLGALDRRLIGPALFTVPAWSPTPWGRAARTAVFAIAAVILLRPVAAEAAAQWGLRKFAGGDGQRAAFWLGVAQRTEPSDWRYHWYAGQFWDAQAADSGKRDAARLAAEAYAAGFDANPLEVKNLLGKISVRRRYGPMLDAPADGRTLQAWLSQAEALAPLNPQIRHERELLRAAK